MSSASSMQGKGEAGTSSTSSASKRIPVGQNGDGSSQERESLLLRSSHRLVAVDLNATNQTGGNFPISPVPPRSVQRAVRPGTAHRNVTISQNLSSNDPTAYGSLREASSLVAPIPTTPQVTVPPTGNFRYVVGSAPQDLKRYPGGVSLGVDGRPYTFQAEREVATSSPRRRHESGVAYKCEVDPVARLVNGQMIGTPIKQTFLDSADSQELLTSREREEIEKHQFVNSMIPSFIRNKTASGSRGTSTPVQTSSHTSDRPDAWVSPRMGLDFFASMASQEMNPQPPIQPVNPLTNRLRVTTQTASPYLVTAQAATVTASLAEQYYSAYTNEGLANNELCGLRALPPGSPQKYNGLPTAEPPLNTTQQIGWVNSSTEAAVAHGFVPSLENTIQDNFTSQPSSPRAQTAGMSTRPTNTRASTATHRTRGRQMTNKTNNQRVAVEIDGWRELVRASSPISVFRRAKQTSSVPDFSQMQLEDALRYLMDSHDRLGDGQAVAFVHVTCRHNVFPSRRENPYDVLVLEQPGYPHSGHIWTRDDLLLLSQQVKILPKHKLMQLSLHGMMSFESEDDCGEMIHIPSFLLEKEQFDFLRTGRFFGLFKELKAFTAWKKYTHHSYVTRIRRKLASTTFFTDQTLVSTLAEVACCAHELESSTELFAFYDRGTMNAVDFFKFQVEHIQTVGRIVQEKVYELGVKIAAKFTTFMESEKLRKMIQDVKDHHPMRDLMKSENIVSVEWVQLRSMQRIGDVYRDRVRNMLQMAQYRMELAVATILERFWLRMKQFVLGITEFHPRPSPGFPSEGYWELDTSLFNEKGELLKSAFTRNILLEVNLNDPEFLAFSSEQATQESTDIVSPSNKEKSLIQKISQATDRGSGNDDQKTTVATPVEGKMTNRDNESSESSDGDSEFDLDNDMEDVEHADGEYYNAVPRRPGFSLLQNFFNYQKSQLHHGKRHAMHEVTKLWQETRTNLCLDVHLCLQDRILNAEDLISVKSFSRVRVQVTPNKYQFLGHLHRICGELGVVMDGITTLRAFPIIYTHPDLERMKMELQSSENADKISADVSSILSTKDTVTDNLVEVATASIKEVDLGLGDLQNSSSSNYFTFLVMHPIYNTRSAYALAVDTIRLYQVAFMEASSIDYYMAKAMDICHKLWSLAPQTLCKQLERSLALSKIRTAVDNPDTLEDLKHSQTRDRRRMVAYVHAQDYFKRLPRYLSYFFDLKHRAGLVTSFRPLVKQLFSYLHIQSFYLEQKLPNSFTMRCSLFHEFIRTLDEEILASQKYVPKTTAQIRIKKPAIQATDATPVEGAAPQEQISHGGIVGGEVVFVGMNELPVEELMPQSELEELLKTRYALPSYIALLRRIRNFDMIRAPFDIESGICTTLYQIVTDYETAAMNLTDPLEIEIRKLLGVQFGNNGQVRIRRRVESSDMMSLGPVKLYGLLQETLHHLFQTMNNAKNILLCHLSELGERVIENRVFLHQRIASQLIAVQNFSFQNAEQSLVETSAAMTEMGKRVMFLRDATNQSIAAQLILVEAHQVVGAPKAIFEASEVDNFDDMCDLQSLYVNRCEVWQVMYECEQIRKGLEMTRLSHAPQIADLNKQFVSIYALYTQLVARLSREEENAPIIQEMTRVISEVRPKVELISYLACRAMKPRHWQRMQELVFQNTVLLLSFSGRQKEIINVIDTSRSNITSTGGYDIRDGAFVLGNLQRLSSTEFLKRDLTRFLRRIRYITAEAVMENVLERTLQVVNSALSEASIQVSHAWLRDSRMREKVFTDLSQLMNLTPLRVLVQFAWKALTIVENTSADMSITVFDTQIERTRNTVSRIDTFLSNYRDIQYVWYHLLPLVKFCVNGEVDRDTLRTFNHVTEEMKKMEISLLQKNGNLCAAFGLGTPGQGDHDLLGSEMVLNNLSSLLEDTHALVSSLYDAYPRFCLLSYNKLVKLLKVWLTGPSYEKECLNECLSIMFPGVGEVLFQLLTGQYIGQFGCVGFVSERHVERVIFERPILTTGTLEEFLMEFESELRQSMEKSADSIALHRVNCIKALVADQSVSVIVQFISSLLSVRLEHLKAILFTNHCEGFVCYSYTLYNTASFVEDVWTCLGHPSLAMYLAKPKINETQNLKLFRDAWSTSLQYFALLCRNNIEMLQSWQDAVTKGHLRNSSTGNDQKAGGRRDGSTKSSKAAVSQFPTSNPQLLRVLLGILLMQEISHLQVVEELLSCASLESALELWVGRFQIRFEYNSRLRYRHSPFEVTMGNLSTIHGFEYREGGFATYFPRQLELAVARVMTSSFAYRGSTFINTQPTEPTSVSWTLDFPETIPFTSGEFVMTAGDVAAALGRVCVSLANASDPVNVRFFFAQLVFLDGVGGIDFTTIHANGVQNIVETAQQFWSAIESNNFSFLSESLKFPIRPKFNRNEFQSERRKRAIEHLRESIAEQKSRNSYLSLVFIGHASEVDFSSVSVFDQFFRGSFDAITFERLHFLDVLGSALLVRGFTFGMELRACLVRTLTNVFHGANSEGSKAEEKRILGRWMTATLLTSKTLLSLAEESASAMSLYLHSKFCSETLSSTGSLDPPSRFRVEVFIFTSVIWDRLQIYALSQPHILFHPSANQSRPEANPLKIFKELFFEEILSHLRNIATDEYCESFPSAFSNEMPSLHPIIKRVLMKSAKASNQIATSSTLAHGAALMQNLLHVGKTSPVVILAGERSVGKTVVRTTALTSINHLLKHFSTKELRFLDPLMQIYELSSLPRVCVAAAHRILYCLRVWRRERLAEKMTLAKEEASTSETTELPGNMLPPTVPLALSAEDNLRSRKKRPSRVSVIYHGSLTLETLLGHVDGQSRWTDGVLLQRVRYYHEIHTRGSALRLQQNLLHSSGTGGTSVVASNSEDVDDDCLSFIVLNGPIAYQLETLFHGLYFQSGVSTFSGSSPAFTPRSALTLPTGEVMELPPQTRLLIECDNMCDASPAFIGVFPMQVVSCTPREILTRLSTVWVRSLINWLGDFPPWLNTLESVSNLFLQSSFLEELLDLQENPNTPNEAVKNVRLDLLTSRLGGFFRILEELILGTQELALSKASFSMMDHDPSDSDSDDSVTESPTNRVNSRTRESDASDDSDLDTEDLEDLDDGGVGLTTALKQLVSNLTQVKKSGNRYGEKFKYYGLMELSQREREAIRIRTCLSIVYAAIWGIGGSIVDTGRRYFESVLRDLISRFFVNGNQEELIELPLEVSLFDCIVDLESMCMRPALQYDANLKNVVLRNKGVGELPGNSQLYCDIRYIKGSHHSIVFRTTQLRAMDNIIRKLVGSGANILLFGSSISGKSRLIKEILADLAVNCPTPDDMRKQVVADLVNIVNEAAKVTGIFSVLELLDLLLQKVTRAAIVPAYEDDFTRYYRRAANDLKLVWAGSAREHCLRKTVSSVSLSMTTVNGGEEFRRWLVREFTSETDGILESALFSYGAMFLDDMHCLNTQTGGAPPGETNQGATETSEKDDEQDSQWSNTSSSQMPRTMRTNLDRPEEVLRGLLNNFPLFSMRRSTNDRNLLASAYHHGSQTAAFPTDDEVPPILHRADTVDPRVQMALPTDYLIRRMGIIGSATGDANANLTPTSELSRLVSSFVTLYLPSPTITDLHVSILTGASSVLSHLCIASESNVFARTLMTHVAELAKSTFQISSKLVSLQDGFLTSPLERVVRSTSLRLDFGFVTRFVNALRLGGEFVVEEKGLIELFTHEWRRTFCDPLPLGTQRDRVVKLVGEVLDSLDCEVWRISRGEFDSIKEKFGVSNDDIWLDVNVLSPGEPLISDSMAGSPRSTKSDSVSAGIKSVASGSPVNKHGGVLSLQHNSGDNSANISYGGTPLSSLPNSPLHVNPHTESSSFAEAVQFSIQQVSHTKNTHDAQADVLNRKIIYRPVSIDTATISRVLRNGTFDREACSYFPSLPSVDIASGLIKTINLAAPLSGNDACSFFHPTAISLLLRLIRVLSITRSHLLLSGFPGTSRKTSLILAAHVVGMSSHYFAATEVRGVVETSPSVKVEAADSFTSFLKRVLLRAVGLSDAIDTEEATAMGLFLQHGEIYYRLLENSPVSLTEPSTNYDVGDGTTSQGASKRYVPSPMLVIIDHAGQLNSEDRRKLHLLIDGEDPSMLFNNSEICGLYDAFRRESAAAGIDSTYLELEEHVGSIVPVTPVSMQVSPRASHLSTRSVDAMSTGSIECEAALLSTDEPTGAVPTGGNTGKHISHTATRRQMTGYMFSWVRARLRNAIQKLIRFAVVAELPRATELSLSEMYTPTEARSSLDELVSNTAKSNSSSKNVHRRRMSSTRSTGSRRFSMLSSRSSSTSNVSPSIQQSRGNGAVYNPLAHHNVKQQPGDDDDSAAQVNLPPRESDVEISPHSLFTCPQLGPMLNRRFTQIWYDVDCSDAISGVCNALLRNERFLRDVTPVPEPAIIALNPKHPSVPQTVIESKLTGVPEEETPSLLQANNEVDIRYNLVVHGAANRFQIHMQMCAALNFGVFGATYLHDHSTHLSDSLQSRNIRSTLDQETLLTESDLALSLFIDEVRFLLPHVLTVPLPSDALFLNSPVYIAGPEYIARQASDLIMYILTTGGRALLGSKQVYEKLLSGYEQALFALNHTDIIDGRLEENNRELTDLISAANETIAMTDKEFQSVDANFRNTDEFAAEAMLREDIMSREADIAWQEERLEVFCNTFRQQLALFSSSDWNAFRRLFAEKPYPKPAIDTMRALMVVINYSPKITKSDRAALRDAAASSGQTSLTIKMDDDMVARCAVLILTRSEELVDQLCEVKPVKLTQVQIHALKIMNSLLNADRAQYLSNDLYRPNERFENFSIHFPEDTEAPNPVFECLRRFLVAMEVIHANGEALHLRDLDLEPVREELQSSLDHNKVLKQGMRSGLRAKIDDLRQQVLLLEDTIASNIHKAETIERNRLRKMELNTGLSAARLFLRSELDRMNDILSHLVSDLCVLVAVLFRAGWLPDHIRQECSETLREELLTHGVRVSTTPLIAGHLLDRLQIRDWVRYTEASISNDVPSINSMSLLQFVPGAAFVIDPDGIALGALLEATHHKELTMSVSAQKFTITLLEHWTQQAVDSQQALVIVIQDVQSGPSEDLVHFLCAQLETVDDTSITEGNNSSAISNVQLRIDPMAGLSEGATISKKRLTLIDVPSRMRVILLSTSPPLLDSHGESSPLPLACMEHLTVLHWAASPSASQFVVDNQPIDVALGMAGATDHIISSTLAIQLSKTLCPSLLDTIQSANFELTRDQRRLLTFESDVNHIILQWMVEDHERAYRARQDLTLRSAALDDSHVSLSMLSSDEIIDLLLRVTPIRNELHTAIRRSAGLFRDASVYLESMSEVMVMASEYVRLCGALLPPGSLSPYALSAQALVRSFFPALSKFSLPKDRYAHLPSSLFRAWFVWRGLVSFQRIFRRWKRSRAPITLLSENLNTASPTPKIKKISRKSILSTPTRNLRREIDRIMEEEEALSPGLSPQTRLKASKLLSYLLMPLRTLFLREVVRYVSLQIRPGLETLLKTILLTASWAQSEERFPVDEMRAMVYLAVQGRGYELKRFCYFLPISRTLAVKSNTGNSTQSSRVSYRFSSIIAGSNINARLSSRSDSRSENSDIISWNSSIHDVGQPPTSSPLSQRITAFRVHQGEKQDPVHIVGQPESVSHHFDFHEMYLECGPGIPDGLWLSNRSSKWQLVRRTTGSGLSTEALQIFSRGEVFYGDTDAAMDARITLRRASRVGNTFELEWLRARGLRSFASLNDAALIALGASVSTLAEISKARVTFAAPAKPKHSVSHLAPSGAIGGGTVSKNTIVSPSRPQSVMRRRSVAVRRESTVARRNSTLHIVADDLANASVGEMQSPVKGRRLTSRASNLLEAITHEVTSISKKQPEGSFISRAMLARRNSTLRKDSLVVLSSPTPSTRSPSFSSHVLNTSPTLPEYSSILYQDEAYSNLLILENHASLRTIFAGITFGISTSIDAWRQWKDQLIMLETVDPKKLTASEVADIARSLVPPCAPYQVSATTDGNNYGLWCHGYELSVIQTWLLVETLWPGRAAGLIELSCSLIHHYLQHGGYFILHPDEILVDSDSESDFDSDEDDIESKHNDDDNSQPLQRVARPPNRPKSRSSVSFKRSHSVVSTSNVTAIQEESEDDSDISESNSEDDDEVASPLPVSRLQFGFDSSSRANSVSSSQSRLSIRNSVEHAILADEMPDGILQDHLHPLNCWSIGLQNLRLCLSPLTRPAVPELLDESASAHSVSCRDFFNWEPVLADALGAYAADADKFVFMKELRDSLCGQSSAYFLLPTTNAPHRAIFTQCARDFSVLTRGRHMSVVFCGVLTSEVVKESVTENRKQLRVALQELTRLAKQAPSGTSAVGVARKNILDLLDVSTIMGNAVLFSAVLPSSLLMAHTENAILAAAAAIATTHSAPPIADESLNEDEGVDDENATPEDDRPTSEADAAKIAALREAKRKQLAFRTMVLNAYKRLEDSRSLQFFSFMPPTKRWRDSLPVVISSPCTFTGFYTGTTGPHVFAPPVSMSEANYAWLPRLFAVDIVRPYSSMTLRHLQRSSPANSPEENDGRSINDIPSLPESVGALFEGMESSLLWVINSMRVVLHTKITVDLRRRIARLGKLEIRTTACLLSLYEVMRYVRCHQMEDSTDGISISANWVSCASSLNLWSFSRLLLKLSDFLSVEWRGASVLSLLSQDRFIAAIQSIVECFSTPEANLYTYHAHGRMTAASHAPKGTSRGHLSSDFQNPLFTSDSGADSIRQFSANIDSLKASLVRQSAQNAKQRQLLLRGASSPSSAGNQNNPIAAMAPGNIRAQKQWKRTTRRLAVAQEDYLQFLIRPEQFLDLSAMDKKLYSILETPEVTNKRSKLNDAFVRRLYSVFAHYLAEVVIQLREQRHDILRRRDTQFDLAANLGSDSGIAPRSGAPELFIPHPPASSDPSASPSGRKGRRHSSKMNIPTMVGMRGSTNFVPIQSGGRSSNTMSHARQSVTTKLDVMCGSLPPREMMHCMVRWTYVGSDTRRVDRTKVLRSIIILAKAVRSGKIQLLSEEEITKTEAAESASNLTAAIAAPANYYV